MRAAFARALTEPYAGSPLGLPKAALRYVVSPEYRVMTKVRHIAYTQGRWSWWLSQRLRAKYPVLFSARAVIGRNFNIPHYLGVVIGRDVVIGDDCTVYQQVTLGQSHDGFPRLGDGVIVFAGAKIVGPVMVGNGAVIGANAVVTRDVPPYAVVGGNPARVIRYRDPERDGGLY